MLGNDPHGEMTQLIGRWSESRAQSIPELVEATYDELRQIARAYMRRERADHTLQATALINEAYLRLNRGGKFRWEDRKHFFCVMAQTMRRVLVDYARKHRSGKRGGQQSTVRLDDVLVFSEDKSPDLLAIDEALNRLGQLHRRQQQVVELRFFAGLTVHEVGAVLEISPETVKLDWRFAKAWLQRELGQTS
jgi:RNA polymerase sigma factor (TIGR02999 family)